VSWDGTSHGYGYVDSNPISMATAALDIGALNQKERPYEPRRKLPLVLVNSVAKHSGLSLFSGECENLMSLGI